MDDDKFATFFLGIMTVLVIAAVAMPLVYTLGSSIFTALTILLKFQSHPRRKYGDEEKPSAFAPMLQALEIFLEIPKVALFVIRNPSKIRAGARLLWGQPSLFFKQCVPRAFSFFVRPKLIVLLLWFFSFYLFLGHVPKAASYDIMGVPPTATPEEIKKAYKALSFRYHPDKDPSESAKEMYAKIRKAYTALTGDKGGEDGSVSDEPLGAGVALPSFLKGTENEGRTLIFLLLIAFGLPSFLLYYLFLRGGKTYMAYHHSLHKSMITAAKLHRAMGMPENPLVRTRRVHIENMTNLLKEASLWQKGMGPEVCEALPSLPNLQKLCSTAVTGTGRGQIEAKAKIAQLGFEDEAMESLCQTVMNEVWTAKSKEEKDLEGDKPVLTVVDADTFETTEYFLGFIMEEMEDSIKAFDIQGKSKKLFKLYADKVALLKKGISSGGQIASGAMEKLLEIDNEISVTHQDIERGAMEYINSSHKRSWKKYQRNMAAEQQAKTGGR